MQDKRTPTDIYRPPVATGSVESRLSWLLAENEREANRSRLLNPADEEELLMMSRPISTEKAFALFGMLLGTFPPAAIFLKLFTAVLSLEIFALLLVMNAICCFVGRWMGARMGRWLPNQVSDSWEWQFIASVGAGIAWGAVTGSAGGLPAFGFGAIFGAIFAMVVGIVAFPLFTLLHRAFARGGMIDARHLWPLAFCIVTVITVLILGM